MVTDFVMYDHRRGPVWSPKGSLSLILPGRAGPHPLTGPRMAMPFGDPTGPRLIGNVDFRHYKITWNFARARLCSLESHVTEDARGWHVEQEARGVM